MTRAALLLAVLLLAPLATGEDAAQAQQVPNPMSKDGANAQLPAARHNLGIQTPASCDGKVAGDGWIAVGTTTFVSAAADFVPADVNKRIAIAGAGANQHLNAITLTGGGAGHTVGQVIPITGGTGTAGSIEVRAVSAGVATEIGQVNLGAYTTPPANPVSAGDITFTATWQRDALATTIAAYINEGQVTLAAPAGAAVTAAKFGFGSDYAAEVNAALVATSQVTLPKGICGVASSINLGSANSLQGVTHRQSSLMWLGPSRGGPVVRTTGVGYQIWYGGRFADIEVQGLGSADTCIDLHGINTWRIEQILGENCVTTTMALEPPGAASTQGSVIGNIFYGVVLNASGAGTTDSAMPLRFGNRDGGPDGSSNIGYNRFLDLRLFSVNQTALQCGYADNNHFYGTWIWQNPVGNARRSIDFQANTNPAQCQGMSFYGLTLAPENVTGNIVARGGGAAPSQGIVIYGLANAAGIPFPTVETGAKLACKSLYGDDNQCTPRAFGMFFGGTKAVTDTAAYRMFGVGTTFTANYSGRVKLAISGSVNNGTAGSGGLMVASYGTGAPPATMAALTGTQCGPFQSLVATPSGTFAAPFSVICNIAGATSGTPYWFDLAGQVLTSGTLTVTNVSVAYDEAP